MLKENGITVESDQKGDVTKEKLKNATVFELISRKYPCWCALVVDEAFTGLSKFWDGLNSTLRKHEFMPLYYMKTLFFFFYLAPLPTTATTLSVTSTLESHSAVCIVFPPKFLNCSGTLGIRKGPKPANLIYMHL
jgi:hypothetical protein